MSEFIAKKERVHWIDVAKGGLILLLVIHHFRSATAVLGIDHHPYGFLYCWNIVFTSFFMQAFFFMSGYCSNFAKPFWQFFKSIFKQLIVPFICFELVSCIFYTHSISLSSIFSYWVESDGTHLWFLNALIVSKVFIWLYFKVSRSEAVLLLTTLFILIGAVAAKQYNIGGDFLCIKQSLGSIFFVAIGHVCKNESYFVKMRYWGWVFPWILLTLLLFHVSIPAFMGGMRVTLKNLPLVIVTSISGTMALINLCMRMKKNKLFEYFGRNSLAVYCLHFIPLVLILKYSFNIAFPVLLIEKVLMITIIYIIEIIVLVGLIEIFARKPFKFMLGRF